MSKKIILPELSVVIPLFNEESRIINSLPKTILYLEESIKDYEIILVDDGSTDQTLQVIEKFKNDHFKILKNEKNYGKGYSIKKGILAANFSLILFSDADFSTPIEELDKFLTYLDQYDIIIGSRGMKDSQISIHQPFFKEWLGRLGNKSIQILLLPGIADTQCGFKLFKKKASIVFTKQTIWRWGFDFEILWLARQMGFKIKEIPVLWKNDQRSKVKSLDYLKTLGELLKIKYKILFNQYDLKNYDYKTNL